MYLFPVLDVVIFRALNIRARISWHVIDEYQHVLQEVYNRYANADNDQRGPDQLQHGAICSIQKMTLRTLAAIF
jgi:hypothetical protein